MAVAPNIGGKGAAKNKGEVQLLLLERGGGQVLKDEGTGEGVCVRKLAMSRGRHKEGGGKEGGGGCARAQLTHTRNNTTISLSLFKFDRTKKSRRRAYLSPARVCGDARAPKE